MRRAARRLASALGSRRVRMLVLAVVGLVLGSCCPLLPHWLQHICEVLAGFVQLG